MPAPLPGGGHTTIEQERRKPIAGGNQRKDHIRREHYFTKMIENAENALREYLQERGGEQTLYVTEYMQRRSYLLE